MVNPVKPSSNSVPSPLIYKIKDQKGKTWGYITGTLHFSDQKSTTLNEKFLKKLSKSKDINVEVNLEKISKEEVEQFKREICIAIARDVIRLSMDEVNEILKTYKECFGHLNEVQEIFKQIEVKNDEYFTRDMLIGLIADLNQIIFKDYASDITFSKGMEQQIINFARDNRKNVLGLELLAEQVESAAPLYYNPTLPRKP